MGTWDKGDVIEDVSRLENTFYSVEWDGKVDVFNKIRNTKDLEV